MRGFNLVIYLNIISLAGSAWASFSFSAKQATPFNPYAHPKSYYESRVDMAEPEQFRIQKHLAGVEADLRQHSPSGLTVAQLEARAQRLDALHEYWTRGEFPKNRDYADSLVPYFIDAEGVPCAVGYLVIASGHGEFAEEINRTQNHAYIREIQDPRLEKWADASGLTLEECAKIQPAYGGWYGSGIKDVAVDTGNNPWVIAYDQLSRIDIRLASWQGQWVFKGQSANYQSLCLTKTGKPLVGMQSGILWGGKTFNTGTSFYSCDRFRDSQTVWMGSAQGLSRVNILTDTSLSVLGPYASPLSSNSISVLAVTRNYAWGGTSVGLAGRNVQTGAWVTRDPTALSGTRVTGLRAGGGDTLWVGLDGPVTGINNTIPQFSGSGLRRYDGQNWVSYRTNTSVLPSDTLQSFISKGGNSLWIYCAAGFYEFTPPTSIRKLVGSVGVVTDMAVGSNGQLYVGTLNSGVYRLQNDTLKSMGYPVVPILAHRKGKTNRTAMVQMLFGGKSEKSGALQTILGQRLYQNPATGIYVTAPHPANSR